MNRRDKPRPVPTRFDRATAFTVELSSAGRVRREQEAMLERLKEQLLEHYLAETDDPFMRDLLNRAARDAAALAWTTPYPSLLFPALFEEKKDGARRYAHYQNQIRRRTALPSRLAA